MNKSFLKIALPFILLLSFKLIHAQINNIKFRRISPAGGFTLKGINTIVQDNLGYIWMGTSQGLIKYDSQNTYWFVPSINDSLSLPNEFINDIFADKDNQLWISTNAGLCQFNRQRQNFTKINYTYEDNSAAKDSVVASIKRNKNELIIIDALYLGILNLNTKKMTRIGKDIIKSPNYIYLDHLNRIWIGTRNGEVFRFYEANSKIEKILSQQAKINCIYSDNNRLWIGTDGKGACQYDLRGNLIKQISFNEKAKDTFGNVRVIKKDTYGRVWFGTYEGLYMHDGKKMVNFNPDEHKGLPHTSIYEIFEDKQGGLWVGTWSGGVALIHHSDNSFQSFQHLPYNNSISNNTVSSFLQINNTELLIGTEVGGLNKFNIDTQNFSTLELSENDDIPNIKTLCQDQYHGIWVGTFRNGLWYRSAGSKPFKSINNPSENGLNYASSSIYSLCPVDSGVWVGTFEQGIFFYHFEKQSITSCFQDTESGKNLSVIPIQSMLIDSNSNLWIGTLFNFLYKIHLPSGEITRIASEYFLSEYMGGSIYCLFEHLSGDIWIGTKNNGILIYHPTSLQYEAFDAQGILNGKDVYGIIEDKNQRLWITSNNGLVLYNPNLNTIRHFLFADGIQSNLFCPQSIYKDNRDNLYFGGTNGFTTIYPDNIKKNTKKPNTIINHLVLSDNKIIYPYYNTKQQLTPFFLSPHDNTFEINFSADNYLMPEKNQYKYRLLNYNNEWIHSGSVGSALFNNIKPGHYTFEVKASNNDGIWNDEPTRLDITIKNFWYKSVGAFIIYGLLFCVLIYLLVRFYSERLKLKRAITNEKLQRENEEQIHEMKLKFFTNISHEFRTPLTLISWPINKLVKADNLTEEQQEDLAVIKSNSNRLLQLINQIIDLRKLDRGKSQLNISKFDLVEFINQIQKNFFSEAKSHQIQFQFECPFTSLYIEADKDKVDTIIYNLFSNAYKYVSDQGTIKVIIYNKTIQQSNIFINQLSFGEVYVDDFITIAIEDNGTGIDSESLLSIFNRFEQGKTTENKILRPVKGSGIGLSICKEFTLLHHGKITAQSMPGKGSRFTIQLPLKQKAQKILYESHQEVKNLSKPEPETSLFKKDRDPINQRTILVVEDNADFRKLICKFLEQYFRVISANNGEEALEMIRLRNIDLIVSDVMMPKMDGMEFCTIVKTQVETSHIPVILLTALSSSENLIAGLDKGADAYITKPFDETILLKQIENILIQRKRIQENFSRQFTSEKTIGVGSLDNYFLKRVKSVIEKNISEENFGIEMLTEELMISRSQLHRKIKALSGMTTSDFVNMVKIKNAIELIENSNCTFNEVAFKVGFSSQSYFTKCFKKVHSMTPKEYFEKTKTETH